MKMLNGVMKIYLIAVLPDLTRFYFFDWHSSSSTSFAQPSGISLSLGNVSQSFPQFMTFNVT